MTGTCSYATSTPSDVRKDSTLFVFRTLPWTAKCLPTCQIRSQTQLFDHCSGTI